MGKNDKDAPSLLIHDISSKKKLEPPPEIENICLGLLFEIFKSETTYAKLSPGPSVVSSFKTPAEFDTTPVAAATVNTPFGAKFARVPPEKLNTTPADKLLV